MCSSTILSVSGVCLDGSPNRYTTCQPPDTLKGKSLPFLVKDSLRLDQMVVVGHTRTLSGPITSFLPPGMASTSCSESH